MASIAQISQQQPLDEIGRIVPGAKAYFYASGTVSPITVYADPTYATPLPNPVTANGSGLFPVIYINEAVNPYYRQRVTNANGAILTGRDIDSVPSNAGTGGGSAPPAVDQTGLMKTGALYTTLGAGIITGFVRLNGNTIGNAASSATERPNADTQLLYEMIWNSYSDTICPVTGGRGANATADFNGGKAIKLLDMRGRSIVGLDQMGASTPASRVTAATATPDGVTPGASGGAQQTVISIAQLPVVNLSVAGVTVSAVGDHTHTINRAGDTKGAQSGGGNFAGTDPATSSAAGAHTHTLSGTIPLGGAGQALDKMHPFILFTIYCKL